MTKYPMTSQTDKNRQRNDEIAGSQAPAPAGTQYRCRANGKRVYDLEERTARFGEAVIAFVRQVARSPVTWSLIDQLVRAGTSVGANYSEADDAESGKDSRHRISICKREARETKHWLRMIPTAEPSLKDAARPLWQEAKELHLIFAAIHRKSAHRRD